MYFLEVSEAVKGEEISMGTNSLRHSSSVADIAGMCPLTSEIARPILQVTIFSSILHHLIFLHSRACSQ